jgi:hypothetical protein
MAIHVSLRPQIRPGMEAGRYRFVPFKTVGALGTAQAASFNQERPAWKRGATLTHKMKWNEPLG